MDWRRLPPSFWAAFGALSVVTGVVGLALGGLLFAHEVKVEVPVEVVRTVDRVVEKPEVLSEDQELWLKLMAPAHAAARSPSVGYMETAVMPFRNKVKVVVLMSDEISERVPRTAVQARVEQAFRDAGVVVLAADSDANDFNTTIFVVFDLMFQNKGSTLVGDVRMNVNQTMLCFSDDLWRKCNVTTTSNGTTVNYGSANFAKLVDVAGDLAPETAKVLLKADEIANNLRGK